MNHSDTDEIRSFLFLCHCCQLSPPGVAEALRIMRECEAPPELWKMFHISQDGVNTSQDICSTMRQKLRKRFPWYGSNDAPESEEQLAMRRHLKS